MKAPGMKLDINEKTSLLLGLFVAAIVASNLLGNKITHIGMDFSVAIFVFPLTFLITDIIAEVHGKKKAQEFVWIGFGAILFVMLFTALFVALPFAERSFVKEEYTKVFGSSLRIMVASIIAFLVAQLHDVWAFEFWKKKTKGNHLWIRNNLSTIASQAIDTVLFLFIAFYYLPFLPDVINTSPKFTALYVITLGIPYYLLKVVAAILDTPFCYWGVWWLRGKQGSRKS